MQLDLGGDNRRTCQTCKMEYVPSNIEDAALHKKFHAKSVGGVDITKALVGKMRENQIWTGADGSFITVIGRKDSPAFRNKAMEVLGVVNTELAAVSIPEETVWSQTSVPDKPGAWPVEKTPDPSKPGKRSSSTSDRFKMYLYIRGQKCIGACLAERIAEAFIVLDGVDASDETGGPRTDLQGSSISVSDAPDAAVLGISRIWTSNLHRKSGVATTLLELARSDFLYGIAVPKQQVAFSQPTESGGRLARKWFGRRCGWHVYVD
jgi:N-acetyltransferase